MPPGAENHQQATDQKDRTIEALLTRVRLVQEDASKSAGKLAAAKIQFEAELTAAGAREEGLEEVVRELQAVVSTMSGSSLSSLEPVKLEAVCSNNGPRGVLYVYLPPIPPEGVHRGTG